MMSLSGVPLFFAGAWTKEAVLHATSRWPVSSIPYYLLLAGVILTTLYMTRQMIYVFFGRPRSATAHESPRGMTGSLVVLAIATIGLSAVLTPAWPWLHSYLSGEPAPFEPAHLVEPMIVISQLCVCAGLALGWLIYRRAPVEDPLATAQPALFSFLANKMWLDEIYRSTVIAVACAASVASDLVDRYFWDGIVRSFGAGARLLGLCSTNLDENGINAGVDDASIGARGLGRLLSRGHSGSIQAYLGAVAFGMIALLVLYAWLG
jgi:NADH-quinone oxidoreductase subunit L